MTNEPQIIKTADGSPSLYLEELDETYHSRHGALQESQHVFIEMGLKVLAGKKSTINILEVGLGTGLNAWLSAGFAEEKNQQINYTGVEAFPLSNKILSEVLELCTKLENVPAPELMQTIFDASWETEKTISGFFTLEKREGKIEEIELESSHFDLVYFDAFGPRAQSEMWEMKVLEPVVKSIAPDGLLVSYCVQGQFRRNLKSLGMEVEKVPGPPGKREMTRAWKK
ncbi:tRNA (5-methylaminomethyl-2-thiouridine)(34)-methyltransferase MnmD [Halocola ammonii]